MHDTSYQSLTGILLDTELTPGSPQWLTRMTASKVATILDLTPPAWDTAYALWHRMAGTTPTTIQSDAMSRGLEFEPMIRTWVADQCEGTVSETGTWKHPDYEHYANPDGLIVTDDGADLLEIKTAKDFHEWGGEIPPYYLAQAMWQMWVTGAAATWFAVCGPFELFNRRPAMIRVERDDSVIHGIVRKVAVFMASLTAGVEPPRTDSSDPTVMALRWKSPTVEPVPVAVPAEIGERWINAYRSKAVAEAQINRVRADLIEYMGTAREAEYDGQIIATRTASTPPSLRKARGTDTLIGA